MNPYLKTRNPKTQTLNHKPSILNHQPSTINPQPSTINHQPSTLNPKSPIPNPKPPTLNPEPEIYKQGVAKVELTVVASDVPSSVYLSLLHTHCPYLSYSLSLCHTLSLSLAASLFLSHSPCHSRSVCPEPLQGYFAHKKPPLPLGPPQGPWQSPTVGS